MVRRKSAKRTSKATTKMSESLACGPASVFSGRGVQTDWPIETPAKDLHSL